MASKANPQGSYSSASKTPAGSQGSGEDLNAQIYFVRHGDTDLNTGSAQTERFRGWGNPPLNEKGMNSAHEAGAFLQDKGIAHIFHTDLTRGEQTAQIIHAHTGADTTPVHGLRPWNMGNLTGQPVEPNIKMVEEYQNKKPDEPLPGGESFHQFQDRWHQTLHTLVHTSANAQRPIAAVTHTRNLNDLKHTVEGKPMETKSMQPPGGIIRMDVRNGKISLHDEDTQEGMKDETKKQE